MTYNSKTKLKQILLDVLRDTNSNHYIETQYLLGYGDPTLVLEILRELVLLRVLTHCILTTRNKHKISLSVWWKNPQFCMELNIK